MPARLRAGDRRPDARPDPRRDPGERRWACARRRLARELDLTQPTVSHHMKALIDEGVLAREPDGRLVWYSIRPGAHRSRDRTPASHRSELDVPDAVLDRITSDLAIEVRRQLRRRDRAPLCAGQLPPARRHRRRHPTPLVPDSAVCRRPTSTLSRQDLDDHRGLPPRCSSSAFRMPGDPRSRRRS